MILKRGLKIIFNFKKALYLAVKLFRLMPVCMSKINFYFCLPFFASGSFINFCWEKVKFIDIVHVHFNEKVIFFLTNER